MKNTLSILITLLLVYGSNAQRVKIEQDKNRIGEDKIMGLKSTLIGDEDDIEGQWYKALRQLGRLREEGNYLTVREAELEGWGEKTIQVYSKITAQDSTIEVWVSVKEDLAEDSIAMAREKLNTFLYDFSLTYYQEKAQEKVEEAERAVAFTEKKYEKLIDEEVELKKDSVSNVNEIERLQQLLEKEYLEEKVILQKLIDNRKNQEQTLEDAERLKAIVEKKKAIKEAIE